MPTTPARRFIVLSLLAGITASSPNCSNSSPTAQGAAAAGTVAGTVVAAPILLPAAGIYHAVNGGVKGKQRRNDEFWKQYDPIYEQRISWIKKRDPLADADRAIREAGGIVFLPYTFDEPLYAGMFETEYAITRLTPEFRTRNENRIRNSKFLMEIMHMASKDPAQVAIEDDLVYSDTFRRFVKVSGPYKDRFNQRVYQKSKR